MKHNPQFSIIIPIYNVEAYVRECLDSVLSQTFTNWEAICIDDGSTDVSGKILDEYGEKDKRFKVLHQKNSGVSAARNAALSVASGEWVTFLDADDRVLPDRLELISEVIKLFPDADWVHETEYISNLRKNEGNVSNKGPKLVTGAEVFLEAWGILKKNALMVLNTYRRAAVCNVRFYEGVRYAEDDIFELTAIPFCKSFVLTGCCGYWYREDRVDAASRSIGVEDSIKIQKLLLKTANEQMGVLRSIGDSDRFKVLFTQTVWKDFNRVFRRIWRAPKDVRGKHISITKEIMHSQFFDKKGVGPYMITYRLYANRGWVWPLILNDYVVRAFLKFYRIFGGAQ